MTETLNSPPAPQIPPPPGSGSGVASVEQRQMALIVYILYLAAFACGITSIVGLVMAYVNRDSAPDWLKSHYTNQIHTFWIALLYFCIAGVLCALLVGFLLLPVVVIWYIVRCAIGISQLTRGEAYPTPTAWII